MGGIRDRKWAVVAVGVGVVALIALFTIGSFLDQDRERGGGGTYAAVVLAGLALGALVVANRRSGNRS